MDTTKTPLNLDLIQRMREGKANDQSLSQRLQANLHLDDAKYVDSVSQFLGLPVIERDRMDMGKPRYDVLPYAEAVSRQCVLLEFSDGDRVLVYGEPFDVVTRNWISQRLQIDYRNAVAHYATVHSYLQQFESSHRTMEQISGSGQADAGELNAIEISLASIAHDTNPVIKFINSTLYDALKSKASDIHMESTPNGMEVKYRIDGVLLHVGGANGTDTAEQAISRIKVLADLDISERRIPQDGRFKVLMNQREIDFRISIMPSIHGEDAVLRVLDKQAGGTMTQLRLDGLGHEPDNVEAIRKLANEPYGLLLVTGPTGSGKSTTLYAILSEINTGEEKIITIEDPVEFQLGGVLQIPVNDKKGLTFARGLRSILRHDPDKILVGEIRDGETAGIAVQAAQTGHLVLTSVHANDCFSVLDRFLHMGVEPHSFVDALIGVVAQRLIRKICPHCITDGDVDEELLRISGLTPDDVADWTFRKGAGCQACRNTGFLGRRAIAEVLRLNDDLKQALIRRAPPSEMKALARSSGYMSMRRMALRQVARGETTLQEVNRATFVD
ncbi:GspE/PulE family protein [Variovorax rhizosphaerae]|uniref:GspE/PulE family protein n=1 Tax=Variovorax rhizosphaerae TaxID=1836200 RepID=A0ABU8WXZ8_9BURK